MNDHCPLLSLALPSFDSAGDLQLVSRDRAQQAAVMLLLPLHQLQERAARL
jgi:hypothetical protein